MTEAEYANILNAYTVARMKVMLASMVLPTPAAEADRVLAREALIALENALVVPHG